MRDATCGPLTTVEWARIEAQENVTDAYLTAWRVILEKHGKDFDTMEMIDGTEYVIGKDDWGAICELLMAFGRTKEAQVEIGLEWMNRGPSGGRAREDAEARSVD